MYYLGIILIYFVTFSPLQSIALCIRCKSTPGNPGVDLYFPLQDRFYLATTFSTLSAVAWTVSVPLVGLKHPATAVALPEAAEMI